MFGIDFSELVVIGIVALIVVGPERLPKVARTAGALLGRMQRYVNGVKADIHREIQLDELKKLQADIQESARNFERSMTSEIQGIEREVGKTIDSVRNDFSQPVAEAVETITGEPENDKEPQGIKAVDAAPSLLPKNE